MGKDEDWVAPKERREAQRIPAAAPAVLLGTALGRVGVVVTDLSRTGCRGRTRLLCRPDETYVLRIGTIEPKAVTAAWTIGGEVGLAFARPLAWSVVTTIAAGRPAAGGDAQA